MRADGGIIADVLDIVCPKPEGASQEIIFPEVDAESDPPESVPNNPAMSSEMLDQYDRLYMEDSEEEEEEEGHSVEADVEEALDLAERLAYSNMHPWDLCAMAFDLSWEYIDSLMDDEWEDATQEQRTKKANSLRKLAKDVNRAETRALHAGVPVFSEYQHIIEHVIPVLIEKWGKLVLRSNEQGQESLGALLKRLLKNSVNKRRTVGTYVRKGKKLEPGFEGPQAPDKVFAFNDTATKQSLAFLRMKVDAMHRCNSRLTKKMRLGKAQKAVIQKGQMLKRERAPTLGLPSDRAKGGVVKVALAGVEHDNVQLDSLEEH